MSDFGIYVHWPFCTAKCPYCDFNSHVRAQIDESGWADGIVRELEHVAALQGAPPEETSRQTIRVPAAQTRTGS